jgi:histidyl-tRNA synthetase
MGLEEGHPEKEGVLVDLASLPEEVKTRVAKKRAQANVSDVTQQMEGLKTDA